MSKVTQLARGTVSHGSQICHFLHWCLRVTKNSHSKEDSFAEPRETLCVHLSVQDVGQHPISWL